MPPERIVGFIWVARQVGLLCEAGKRNGIVSSTANLQPLENHQTEQSFSVCQLQGNLPYHLGVTEVMVFLLRFFCAMMCSVFILLRFSQTDRGQDSFSKQLYETMRDRSMCNDPNQNPVGPAWI